MLKVLGLSLILLCAIVYADDDTRDNQDKLQLVDQKTFYTYLPNQVWHQLGTYQFNNNSLNLKAGFFNTSVVSQALIRQYNFLGIQKDFYTLKCKTYKQSGNTKYEMYIESMGLPDSDEFFLVGHGGKIVASKTTFDKSSEIMQNYYLQMGKCWLSYQKSETPFDLYSQISTEVSGDEEDDERPYADTVIKMCKQGRNDWVYWNIRDYVCVDKDIVGKNPDMMKHGERLNFDKNST